MRISWRRRRHIFFQTTTTDASTDKERTKRYAALQVGSFSSLFRREKLYKLCMHSRVVNPRIMKSRVTGTSDLKSRLIKLRVKSLSVSKLRVNCDSEYLIRKRTSRPNYEIQRLMRKYIEVSSNQVLRNHVSHASVLRN